MCRQIRSGNIKHGLVLANGGVLSYQHALCLSSKRRANGVMYPDSRLGSGAVVGGSPAPSVRAFAEGVAVVEVSMILFIRPKKKVGTRGSADTQGPRRTRSSSVETGRRRRPLSSAGSRPAATASSPTMATCGPCSSWHLLSKSTSARRGWCRPRRVPRASQRATSSFWGLEKLSRIGLSRPGGWGSRVTYIRHVRSRGRGVPDTSRIISVRIFPARPRSSWLQGKLRLALLAKRFEKGSANGKDAHVCRRGSSKSHF